MKWDPDSEKWVDSYPVPPPPKPRRKPASPAQVFVRLGIAVVAVAVLVTGGSMLVGGDNEGGTKAPASPQASPPRTIAPSTGITQAQLNRLGASIEARYEAGDDEVAQALLDDFMAAHPECVPAILGASGLKEAKVLAKGLVETAPHPQAYATIIAVRRDGELRVAVLGVSCDG